MQQVMESVLGKFSVALALLGACWVYSAIPGLFRIRAPSHRLNPLLKPCITPRYTRLTSGACMILSKIHMLPFLFFHHVLTLFRYFTNFLISHLAAFLFISSDSYKVKDLVSLPITRMA